MDIIGTNASETLPGTSSDDTIQGLGGGDTIPAGDGNDVVSGGDGSDRLNGGDGDDTIYGHGVADLDPSSGAINISLVADVGNSAVFLTGAPGDDGFVYVLRKETGEVLRVDAATGTRTTFLGIPQNEFSDGGERGVLGLAFHPDYESNGRFFVFLTTPSGSVQVREYARSAGDETVADAVPVANVITIPHPGFSNHNGGYLGFGPDGYLYVSVGDGGGSNDPNNNGQNIDVLLGKILRLDVTSDAFPGDPDRNYAIPASNPFAGATPGADEIWAYGLRNPWRMSFDSATGDMYIGDVGQGAREEVDFEPTGSPGGRNYGWDLREGSIPGPSWPPGQPVVLTDPVFDYGHDQGHSITGGYVYHGPAPGLQGAYFFADFVNSKLFTLRMVNGVAEEPLDRTGQVIGGDLGFISSFGVDNDGNLYVVSFGGAIYRVEPAAAAGDGNDIIDGGDGVDTIYGGIGHDIVAGGADGDTLDGGGGADTLNLGDKTARVTVALDGANWATVFVNGVAEDTIRNFENVIGGSGNDSLIGDGGGNALNGAAGADTMIGLAGNDSYYADHIGDTVQETAGGGVDKVYAAVSYVLDPAADVEILLARDAVGTAALDLYGSNVAQQITGNAGANLIDGKGGTDTMIGLAGNDRYYVDTAGDVVHEVAGGGGDKVYAAVSYTLGIASDIESFTARDAASTAALNLTGSNIGQRITGNAGVNIIEGRGGADIMTGLGGGDFYYVDNSGDAVQEAAGGGFDTVFTTVSHSLGAMAEVERLSARDSNSTNAIAFTGNGFGQAILGNAGMNVIYGKGGADTLTGRGGADNFIFDTTLGAGNIDTITDFSSADDTIRLDDVIFTGLTAGAYLAADQFHVGAAAADSLDRIIYNDLTGALLFDSDGDGTAAARQFALAAIDANIDSTDFYVV